MEERQAKNFMCQDLPLPYPHSGPDANYSWAREPSLQVDIDQFSTVVLTSGILFFSGNIESSRRNSSQLVLCDSLHQRLHEKGWTIFHKERKHYFIEFLFRELMFCA